MDLNNFSAAFATSSVAELQQYSESGSAAVRFAVAQNAATPADILLKLASDPVPDVRDAALERLPEDEAERIMAAAAAESGIGIGRVRTTMPMSTLPDIPGRAITESRGLVFGSSSRVAWGFNKQSDRLSQALIAALLDLENSANEVKASAVVGVTFAVNSSAGSSVNILGSSEGILVVGTAVILDEL